MTALAAPPRGGREQQLATCGPEACGSQPPGQQQQQQGAQRGSCVWCVRLGMWRRRAFFASLATLPFFAATRFGEARSTRTAAASPPHCAPPASLTLLPPSLPPPFLPSFPAPAPPRRTEFWQRYVRYLEARGDEAGAKAALDRGVLVFCKRRPEMHMFAAHWDELHGDIAGARARYVHLLTHVSPRLIEAVTSAANFERRQGDLAAANKYLSDLTEEERSKEGSRIYPFLAIHLAHFLRRHSGDLAAARKVRARVMRGGEGLARTRARETSNVALRPRSICPYPSITPPAVYLATLPCTIFATPAYMSLHHLTPRPHPTTSPPYTGPGRRAGAVPGRAQPVGGGGAL